MALAEDAVQHALLRALSLWPFHGVPDRPLAWLSTVARNHALDMLRHEARSVPFDLDEPPPVELVVAPVERRFDRELNDDELALLFAVCHPVLSPALRVSFALKTVCGLSVQQIAAGLLADPVAISQRLVRARQRLASTGTAIAAPPPEALPARAESVRTALYLMFNEGYSASSGEALVQPELCIEALRLARALARHPMTAGPASDALAALLALTAARLSTRVGPDGVAQLLEDQPREWWDRGLIALGLAHLERSAAGEVLTAWHLRAEIAALHATAPSLVATDWTRIAALYEDLLRLDPSPVTALARAVAVGRVHGAAAGLAALPVPDDSPYAAAARGVFLAELGRNGEARSHIARARDAARTGPERRALERRLSALGCDAPRPVSDRRAPEKG